MLHLSQGDHLSGKPGNVREFDSLQGNVRDFTKSQGKNLVREKWPKTVYFKLNICVNTGIYCLEHNMTNTLHAECRAGVP